MGCPLAIIVNANAHKGAFVRRHLSALRAKCRADERLYVSHSRDELARIAAEVAAARPDTVALLGGDGTLTATLSALYSATGALPERVLVLRGGTMNTVASGLGVPRGTPLSLLERFRGLDAQAGRRAYTLELDGRVGFLFSAGLMYAFLAEYYTQPLGTGVFGAGSLLASGVASALVRSPLAARLSAGLSVSLQLDAQRLPMRDYLFVGAATVPEVGLGFAPYARVLRAPEGFQLLAYAGRIRGLVPRLVRFARGAAVPDTVDALVRTAVIDAGEQPIPYSLDGELYESRGPISLRLGPAIRVLP